MSVISVESDVLSPVGARSDPRELTCRIYSCPDEIDPALWPNQPGNDDWGMNLAALGVQQRALEGQARVWFAIVTDRCNAPVASAVLALFFTDVAQSASALSGVANQIRALAPGFLRLGVLFCGLPVPCGGNHLRISRQADEKAVLACLDAEMQELARCHGARLLVFKEFNPMQSGWNDHFRDLGYLRGPIPPMHHLRQSFHSLAGYRQALRSSYRRQLDASLRKFDAMGLQVHHHTEAAGIAAAYTDGMHELYTAVVERSAERLEIFPTSFFRELPHALPGRVALTVLERNNRPAAFAYCVQSGRSFHNLFVGVDYSLNRAADLYFNVFYHSIDAAFRRGVDEITLGQTSDRFKSRLGAVAEDLHFYARATGRTGQTGLRLLSEKIFPKIKPVRPRRVFNRV